MFWSFAVLYIVLTVFISIPPTRFTVFSVVSWEIVIHDYSGLHGISLLLSKVFSSIARASQSTEVFSRQQSWKLIWELIPSQFTCMFLFQCCVFVSMLCCQFFIEQWRKLSKRPRNTRQTAHTPIQGKPPILQVMVLVWRWSMTDV